MCSLRFSCPSGCCFRSRFNVICWILYVTMVQLVALGFVKVAGSVYRLGELSVRMVQSVALGA